MHKFGVWSPMWGHHFLTETGQVCETWDLTLRLGSWTPQKILSFLDLLVKVSNIIWSVHLTAECTERYRADGITSHCAATDGSCVLHIAVLSRVLQNRLHHWLLCSNWCLLYAAQFCIKCCRNDCITGHYAVTDVRSMLCSPALSWVLQRRWHYQS